MIQENTTLHKIPWFHLVFWCENSVETHHPKLCGNCSFSKKFHNRKLGKITVVYAVQFNLISVCFSYKLCMKILEMQQQVCISYVLHIKENFSAKSSFGEFEPIRSFPRKWSCLQKTYLMQNVFCACSDTWECTDQIKRFLLQKLIFQGDIFKSETLPSVMENVISKTGTITSACVLIRLILKTNSQVWDNFWQLEIF